MKRLAFQIDLISKRYNLLNVSTFKLALPAKCFSYDVRRSATLYIQYLALKLSSINNDVLPDST